MKCLKIEVLDSMKCECKCVHMREREIRKKKWKRQIHSFKLVHVIFQSYKLQNVTVESKTHKLIWRITTHSTLIHSLSLSLSHIQIHPKNEDGNTHIVTVDKTCIAQFCLTFQFCKMAFFPVLLLVFQLCELLQLNIFRRRDCAFAFVVTHEPNKMSWMNEKQEREKERKKRHETYTSKSFPITRQPSGSTIVVCYVQCWFPVPWQLRHNEWTQAHMTFSIGSISVYFLQLTQTLHLSYTIFFLPNARNNHKIAGLQPRHPTHKHKAEQTQRKKIYSEHKHNISCRFAWTFHTNILFDSCTGFLTLFLCRSIFLCMWAPNVCALALAPNSRLAWVNEQLFFEEWNEEFWVKQIHRFSMFDVTQMQRISSSH